jgi:hypothetical protein
MDETNKLGGNTDPQRQGYPSREGGAPDESAGYAPPQGNAGTGNSDSMTRRMDATPPVPPAYGPPPAGQSQYTPPASGQQPYYAPPAPQYTPPQPAPPYQPPQQYTPQQPVQPYQQPVQGTYYAGGANAALGGYAANPPVKDPNIAMLIEIVLGIFGFLGVGHILAGRVVPGIVMLVSWWVAIALGWIVGVVIAVLTLGLGLCLAPIFWLGVPIASGIWLRNEMLKQPGFRP